MIYAGGPPHLFSAIRVIPVPPDFQSYFSFVGGSTYPTPASASRLSHVANTCNRLQEFSILTGLATRIYSHECLRCEKLGSMMGRSYKLVGLLAAFLTFVCLPAVANSNDNFSNVQLQGVSGTASGSFTFNPSTDTFSNISVSFNATSQLGLHGERKRGLGCG